MGCELTTVKNMVSNLYEWIFKNGGRRKMFLEGKFS
jgi:hypothetical protein